MDARRQGQLQPIFLRDLAQVLNAIKKCLPETKERTLYSEWPYAECHYA
jgi:hypothetical protein